MAYTTAAKIYLAWADIPEAEAGATRVADAITYSDAIIDAKLTHRYTVPFSSTPDIVAGISTDFAAYIVKYRKDPRVVSNPQTELERQVALSASVLEQLRTGEMNIPGESQKQLVESDTEDYYPIYDVDDELNQIVDEDRLDDIEDDRE